MNGSAKRKRPIGLGVLGVGRMGLYHCERVTQTPGLKLIAASSRAPEWTAVVRQRFSIRTYCDHRALLEDAEVDWVVIATTTAAHYEWTIEAIEHGKNLIVEKPVAPTLKESEEIFATAQQQGVLTTVYQSRRWDDDFKLVRRIIAEQTLGEVFRVESRYTDFNPAWGAQGDANPWRLKNQYGGGLLNDWGPHLFDQLLLLFLGRPQLLLARTYSKIWSEEVDDHFWAEVTFEGGFPAFIEAANTYRLPQPRWCLVGTRGTLVVPGGDPSTWNKAVIKGALAGFPAETVHRYRPIGAFHGVLRRVRRPAGQGSGSAGKSSRSPGHHGYGRRCAPV